MNYKIQGAIRRNRNNFIIYFIVWILIAVFLAPAITNGYAASKALDLSRGLANFKQSIVNPIMGFKGIFINNLFGQYIFTLSIGTIIYSIFFFVGFVKSAPKNEFTDIEHGSSDWSQHGEQYKIISKTKGIILGENNYLPVNKRGNVNVLVVGRIWCW